MPLVGSNNEQKIWNFLKGKGLSDHGVAGLMGNLYAESGLRPNNLQNSYEGKLGMADDEYTELVDHGTYTNFAHDSAGYGLAQWTYWSRKEALLAYAKAQGASIGDLEMQLGYLVKELTSYGLIASLKTATSVRAASDLILLKFEKPAGMNSEATQSKRASYGQTYYDKYATKTAVTGGTTSMNAVMTAAQFAAKAKDIAENFETTYMLGPWGWPTTQAMIDRACNSEANGAKNKTWLSYANAIKGKGFIFDCVGLLKGLLWGWSGNLSKSYGGAGYACNGVPDIGADTMIAKCPNASTDFSKIEVGEVVWMSGHIGIYIGGGVVVESTPRWKWGVQKSTCLNVTKTKVPGTVGTRTWTKHGKLPYVSYTGQSENVGTSPQTPAAPTATQGTASSLEHKVGDIVDFVGSTHYANANAATGPACKPGKAKVTQVFKNGKHPYHLVAVSGGGSTVYGWVNAADISAGGEEYTVVKGDSLWAIAQKHLGSGSRYPEIMELNGLKSTNIQPGQKLRLPS